MVAEYSEIITLSHFFLPLRYDCFDRNILWINLGINKIQCIYSEREIWVLKSETLKERNSQFTALVLLFSVNNIIQLFSTVNSNVSIFRLENKDGGVTWGPFEQSWKQDLFKGLSRYCLYHSFDFHLSFSKKRFPWADKWLFFKTSKTTFFFHSLPRKLLVKNKAWMMQIKRYLA